MSEAKNGSSRLDKFSGKKSDFVTWKDKVITHIAQQDEGYQRKLLEKNQPDANVLMKDFLDSTPKRPVLAPSTASSEEQLSARWEDSHWKRARADVRDLLNKALPDSFLSTLPDTVSKMEPSEVWKALERNFGAGDLGGLLDLKSQWGKVLNSNWKTLSHLFANLKKLRNDMNRKTKALVGKELISESWVCLEVLGQLPSEFWASSIELTGEGFTLDKVEKSLKVIFGEKSKKDFSAQLEQKKLINLVNKARGYGNPNKRKSNERDGNQSGCFYCFEEGHQKADCAMKKKDRDPERVGGPLFRTNKNSKPSSKTGKKITAVKRQKLETSTEADDILAQDDEDLRIDDEDLQIDTDESMGSPGVASGLEQLELEVSTKYKNYLKQLKRMRVTDNMWIVDTGAGHAITPSKQWFVSLNRSSSQTFVYGNGSTSQSTVNGVIQLPILTPKGNVASFRIGDVALDPNCGSNIVSACYLARQGYPFVQSRSGEYLYFFEKSGKLLFAAVQKGEVYYLPSQQRVGVHVVAATSKPAKKYSAMEKEKLLKSLHIRFGHMNRQNLIRMITQRRMANIPFLPHSELKDTTFFCKTCALAKSRRMSY